MTQTTVFIVAFICCASSSVVGKDLMNVVSNHEVDETTTTIPISYTHQLQFHRQRRLLHRSTQRSRFLEEPSECEVATSNITANETYSTIRELIDNDIIEIMNHTNPEANVTCTGNGTTVDGFEVCIGNINPFTAHNLETLCTSIGGQIVQIENTQVTCNPSSSEENDETLTKIVYIPECVGSPCDEDFIADYIDDVYDAVADIAMTVNGLPGTCIATEGSDGPVSSAFTVRQITSFVSVSLVVLLSLVC